MDTFRADLDQPDDGSRESLRMAVRAREMSAQSRRLIALPRRLIRDAVAAQTAPFLSRPARMARAGPRWYPRVTPPPKS